MNIILEGPDSSGKSTLARVIIAYFAGELRYVPTQGPEKYAGEIVTRIHEYLKMDGCLFDRHPVVSQSIYGQFRSWMSPVPQELTDRLYATEPLIIFCDGDSLQGHQVKDERDDESHLAMIERFDANIRNAYREWAKGRAHINYRIGDPIDPIIHACQEFLHGE